MILKLTAPILLGLFSAIIFALPPQMHEIYRSIAQQLPILGWRVQLLREPIIALLSLISLMIVLFAYTWSRIGQGTVEKSTQNNSLGIRSRVLCSVFVCLFPAIGMLCGLLLARLSPEDIPILNAAISESYSSYIQKYENFPTNLAKTDAIVYAETILKFNVLLLWGAILVLIFAFITATLCGYSAIKLNFSGQTRRIFNNQKRHYTVIGLFFITCLLVAVFVYDPVNAPTSLSTIGLVTLFLLLLIVWMWFLGNLSKKLGFPLAGALVAAAVCFSIFDLNDNHRIRQVTKEAKNKAELFEPATAKAAVGEFLKWYRRRPDRATYEGSSYPVYIVAAQGGGIYAAFHSASFLASLQDVCGNFADHLLAISGVSGGSVGASVFASLVKQAQLARTGRKVSDVACTVGTAPTKTDFADATVEIFSRDHLSPLVAALLFPDFMQRFLFLPINTFDRARWSELALEHWWIDTITMPQFSHLNSGANGPFRNILSEEYKNIWQPDRRSQSIALLLNTTEAHSGKRRVIAPFVFHGTGLEFFPPEVLNGEVQDRGRKIQHGINLSTAAHLSARFPWISPAGWFEERQSLPSTAINAGDKIRVVDGGYFENSGIVTALDLINTVRADPRVKDLKPRVEFNLLVLTSAGFTTRRFYGLGEGLEPVRAMLNSRAARAEIEIARAEQTSNDEEADGDSSLPRTYIHRVMLDGLGYPLPLGWRLSPLTRALIVYRSGLAEKCGAKNVKQIQIDNQPSVDCIKKLIQLQLSGQLSE